MGERHHRAHGLGKVGLLTLAALPAVLAGCGINVGNAPASAAPSASAPAPSPSPSAVPASVGPPAASAPVAASAPAASATTDIFGPAEALLRAGYPGEAAQAARSALVAAGATDPKVTLPQELQGLPGRDFLTGAISSSPVLGSILTFLQNYWLQILLVVG